MSDNETPKAGPEPWVLEPGSNGHHAWMQGFVYIQGACGRGVAGPYLVGVLNDLCVGLAQARRRGRMVELTIPEAITGEPRKAIIESLAGLMKVAEFMDRGPVRIVASNGKPAIPFDAGAGIAHAANIGAAILAGGRITFGPEPVEAEKMP